MSEPTSKSTVDEIRERFDSDVERFSKLDSGQASAIDARLMIDLVASAACSCSSPVNNVLDVGCGAGNNTIRLRQLAGEDFDVDLLDISGPMLERAHERVAEINNGEIVTVHADFREADLTPARYDVVIAAAVFHHLRDDADWEHAFAKVYSILKPGGSFWISDLVSHEVDAVQQMMWARYGDYLSSAEWENYRDRVFDYIAKEDSPRSVTYQLELLKQVGYSKIENLHKNSCFAAFGAIK